MELLPSHQFIEQLFGPGGVQQLLQRLRVGEQTVDLSGLVLVDAFQGLVKGCPLQLALQLGRIGAQLLAGMESSMSSRALFICGLLFKLSPPIPFLPNL